jgi:hypothetical protein
MEAQRLASGRRLFRFSLRAFLIVVTLFSVWIGVKSTHARRQKAAVEWVLKHHGNVYYDWQVDATGDIVAAKPPNSWLRTWIGHDYFESVIGVSVCGAKVSDISLLSGLSELKYADLWGNSICDLSPIAGLRQLRTLSLTDNQITDIAPLGRLKNLEALRLANNHITDCTPLQSLKTLKVVEIRNNPIGKREIEDMRRALPKLFSIDSN